MIVPAVQLPLGRGGEPQKGWWEARLPIDGGVQGRGFMADVVPCALLHTPEHRGVFG